MLDRVRLKCPFCNGYYHYSVPYIEGQIKAMKIYKRDEVAKQMHDKRGPFYDKWLAAMEKRGEQMRCRDCLYLDGQPSPRWSGSITCREALKNPGCFACGHFYLKC